MRWVLYMVSHQPTPITTPGSLYGITSTHTHTPPCMVSHQPTPITTPRFSVWYHINPHPYNPPPPLSPPPFRPRLTPTSPTHKGVLHGWLHRLRPGDAYMRKWTNHHWFRLWLAAWSAPSHNYLNQCCRFVNSNLWNTLMWNLKRESYTFIQ